jgi:hypothetical protein
MLINYGRAVFTPKDWKRVEDIRKQDHPGNHPCDNPWRIPLKNCRPPPPHPLAPIPQYPKIPGVFTVFCTFLVLYPCILSACTKSTSSALGLGLGLRISVSRDFLTSSFFSWILFSRAFDYPSIASFLFLRKSSRIFTAQGAPLVLTIPAAS